MKIFRILLNLRRYSSVNTNQPRNLICFKDWDTQHICKILESTKNLKNNVICRKGNLDILEDIKVVLLMEERSPFLRLSSYRAAKMLGADYARVFINSFIDEQHNCEYYSLLSDVLLLVATKHNCLLKFAARSEVPVLCLKSRVYQSVQSLSCLAVISEEFDSISGLNISYVGRAEQLLNSFLLLCPMLGLNLKFFCCCQERSVSPILLKEGHKMSEHQTLIRQCKSTDELYDNTDIYIRGPKPSKKEDEHLFALDFKQMDKSGQKWLYINSCPSNKQEPDELFLHTNAKTRCYVENLEYVCAALMAYSVKGVLF